MHNGQKVVELKAQAYDLVCTAERHQIAITEIQKRLIQVNDEIRGLMNVVSDQSSTDGNEPTT